MSCELTVEWFSTLCTLLSYPSLVVVIIFPIYTQSIKMSLINQLLLLLELNSQILVMFLSIPKNKLHFRNFNVCNFTRHKLPISLKFKCHVKHISLISGSQTKCHMNKYVQLVNSAQEEIALKKNEYEQFVNHFKQASHYIVGHQGKTFVIVIPGEVLTTTITSKSLYK